MFLEVLGHQLTIGIPKAMFTIDKDPYSVNFLGAHMGEISTMYYNGQVAERDLNAT